MTIRDQNDNAPTMDQNPLTGTKSIVVVEDVTVGTVLAVVRATDPDVGENAVICYGITSGNDLGNSCSCHSVYSHRILYTHTHSANNNSSSSRRR